MMTFTEREKTALKQYRYKGGDNSYIYKNLLRPFGNFAGLL